LIDESRFWLPHEINQSVSQGVKLVTDSCAILYIQYRVAPKSKPLPYDQKLY